MSTRAEVIFRFKGCSPFAITLPSDGYPDFVLDTVIAPAVATYRSNGAGGVLSMLVDDGYDILQYYTHCGSDYDYQYIVSDEQVTISKYGRAGITLSADEVLEAVRNGTLELLCEDIENKLNEDERQTENAP